MSPANSRGIGKRAFDILVAAAGIVVLAPVLIVTAVAVRLVLGRPIVFRQTRPGLFGAPFTLCKFRTMRQDTGPDGNPLPDVDRLTPFGRFLRSSSIDELPTLWNVLKGDMSLVGPRPLLMEYLELYSPEQMRRHDTRPGITGWAQVNGRNAIGWDRKLEYDVWYVDNQSLWLDLKIVAWTFKMVLLREGINQPGQVTMEKFRRS